MYRKEQNKWGGVRKFCKKIAKFILASQPENYVEVKISQVNYGEILKNKNIVITGGGRGLGYYMAKKCIQEGANVIISGRDENKLIKACKELGKNCSYIVFDISDVDNANLFIKQCCKKFKNGVINALINNAGINLYEGSIENVTTESFDKQFDINLRGTYFLSKAFIEKKIENKENEGESELIIISSQGGSCASDLPYRLTKASLNSLIQALAKKYYKSGIRVNGIAPGVTISDMTKDYAGTNGNNLATDESSGRCFLPEEIAEVTLFLLSDASKCISGEILHCNAGNHINI